VKVYRSNRVERLLAALAEVVSEPLPDPIASECVVVHSRGMGTWLSQRLAEHVGVWAGGHFPFPRRFVDDVLRSVLGDDAVESGFAPDRLLWPILAELSPSTLSHAAFADLARYLADDSDGGRSMFQLARRIAAVFDQYVVFRPELVLAWDAGRDDHWQARLWRSVSTRLGGRHPAALARDLFDALERRAPTHLPARVCVFGVSTVPPFYLRILQAIDRHVPVHLFVVSPSRAWWAEVQSHRDLLRNAGDDPPALDDDDAPPLLASLGTVGRDFQLVLESTCDYVEPHDDLYVDPGHDTMLRALQSDILAFQRRGPGGEPPLRIAASDDSIAVHACHSPMREVEVLHDRILGLLAADPTLEPRDIAVLCSDIEAYAPLVEAVFERDASDPAFVPYCVADRPLRANSPVVEAFHRVLDLVGARLTASEVVDLLALPPIQQRFSIAHDEVDTIAGWIAEAGIRWGIDEQHRKQHKQPGYRENTWRFGLDRLFLGFALPRNEKAGLHAQVFADVLPYDELEGADTMLLGRFADLCERLFSICTRGHAPPGLVGLDGPRSPRQWQVALTEVVDALLVGAPTPGGGADGAWDAQQLRAALEAVASDAEAAAYDGPLPLHAMIELVDAKLEDDAAPRGFLTGGVTLCAMLPMRSIPFRVVCLLGMGDTDFPRGSPRVGFDLVARRPRPGDRSRRADDRYLFLEALLAARERVLIFHVGQSVQDNSDIPPSVVVSELLDELGQAFIAPFGAEGADGVDPEAMRRHVVVRHPMQPFSPRYFGADDDPRLYSYESSYADGAAALVGVVDVARGPSLLTRPLPDPRARPDAVHQLPLSRLHAFFRMPAADLLKRRLGLYLDDYTRDHSDREPMELDPLDEWRLGADLLEHELLGVPQSESLALLKAGGELPLGTPGRCRYDDLVAAVQPIVSEARRWCEAAALPHLSVDLPIGTTRVVGTIRSRYPAATTAIRFARVSAKHLMQAWIDHLAACLTSHDAEIRSVVVGRSQKAGLARVCRFGRVDEPERYLAKLVELYWIGQREPLLLFPKTSLAFCESLQTRKDPDTAFEAARKVWNDRQQGERDDPSLRRLFGTHDVLARGFSIFEHPMAAGDFAELAIDVFCPMLAHMEGEG
jgi:exodeoxyribonuclease V gamma subunit